MKSLNKTFSLNLFAFWLFIACGQTLAKTTVTINAGTTLVTIPNAVYGNNAQYYNANYNGTDTTLNTAMKLSDAATSLAR